MLTVYFNMLLNEVTKMEGSIRDKIQQLVESAVETYGEHGDTSRLERLVNASKFWPSIRTNTLKNFIKAHANVRFVESKNLDSFTVKKIGKGAIEVKPIDTNWYDFDTDGQVKKDLDLMIAVKSLMTRYSKALNDGSAKTSVEIDQLAAIISAQLEANKATA